VADDAFASYPGGVEGARTDARRNRAFLGRAVRHLAQEVGIRDASSLGRPLKQWPHAHAGYSPEKIQPIRLAALILLG
jgi:hypothetical protein